MGRNVVQRLQDGAIDAKKGTLVHVPIGDIWVPPKGHPLFHPRFGDPLDPEMVADIKARGVEKPIKVRDDGEKDGKRILLLVDGGRRTCNGLEAQRLLRQTLFVPIEFFAGTDAEVLLERIRANADPLKQPDKPSVLALTVQQLRALGPVNFRQVAKVMRGVSAGDVEALCRWNNLTAEARERFDAGAPLGLLAAVLDAPRDEQVATLDRLMANGVRTAKGATRQANKAKDSRDPWARRMSPRQAVRMAADVSNAVFGAQSIDTALHTLAKFGKRESAIVTAGLIAGLHIGANESTEAVLDALPANIANAIRDARQKGRKA